MEYIQFEYFQWKKDVQSNKWDMQQSALISLQSVYSQKYMKGHCSECTIEHQIIVLYFTDCCVNVEIIKVQTR